MNYYEKHIGDYIRDTVSLSMIEDGAHKSTDSNRAIRIHNFYVQVFKGKK